MVVPGYDPDDPNDRLEELLTECGLTDYLALDECERYDSGGSLISLLPPNGIHGLLDGLETGGADNARRP